MWITIIIINEFFAPNQTNFENLVWCKTDVILGCNIFRISCWNTVLLNSFFIGIASNFYIPAIFFKSLIFSRDGLFRNPSSFRFPKFRKVFEIINSYLFFQKAINFLYLIFKVFIEATINLFETLIWPKLAIP